MQDLTQARRKFTSGEIILCMSFLQARSIDVPMIAAAAGFDAIYVDTEHSATSVETTAMLCNAATGYGLIPLVRVPSHHSHDATVILDNGAMGIIAPHVQSRAQAEAIVDNCKYPPLGHRSVSGLNPSAGYRRMPSAEMISWLNQQIIIVMLESAGAIERADEIAAVAGVDVLFIGSQDLTADMGIPGQLHNPRLREAYAVAAKACKAHGKCLGIGGVRNDAELMAELVAMGARFISTGSDTGYMLEAAARDVATLRKIKV
jgi:4-hydroxy-2-oxoheptanedioate aldolase